MDWVGVCPATSDDLAGRRVLEQGWAHIIILKDYGATIDGHRPLDADGIVPNLTDEGVYGREVFRILARKHLEPSGLLRSGGRGLAREIGPA